MEAKGPPSKKHGRASRKYNLAWAVGGGGVFQEADRKTKGLLGKTRHKKQKHGKKNRGETEVQNSTQSQYENKKQRTANNG